MEELLEIIAWSQLGIHDKPVNQNFPFSPILEFLMPSDLIINYLQASYENSILNFVLQLFILYYSST